MMPEAHRYFIINKPYNMVSQFVSPDKVGLLKDVPFAFPEGIHAVGRLDNDSEGLLILTTNKKVTKLLFESKVPHKRTYLVQVRNIVTPEKLLLLQTGVTIRIKGGEYYTTGACDVQLVDKPANLFGRADEFKEGLPNSWLLITLTEGKYHQVRKMTAAVKHRCKRLIRLSIEDLALGNLQPGEVKELEEQDFFKQLKIDWHR
ncbi:pseudouridine synthase [Ferruginibacter paludis]|uniref:pseudouridine synthase n=1 Tax=Ferruginibacter paludis TaxID=1310417 RepID=UPI0025B45FD6|nr:pseudouridine synthase [Ferruginibacter paludis]MDN3657545.1 pseudouridine synthase [Ferruginibacter paludis]